MRTPSRPIPPPWARLFFALAFLTGTATAGAQQPVSLRYKRGADTIRYDRIDTLIMSGGLAAASVATVAGDSRSDTAGSLGASAGQSQQSMIQVATDGVIALSFTGKDQASVWLDSLDVSSDAPGGASDAGAAEAIGKPYLLRFDDRGPLELKKIPSYESPILREAEISSLLDCMFPRFPDKPMARMAPWTDTLVLSYTANGRVVKVTAAGTYRIIRDSLVDSIPTIVISGHVQLTRETTGEVGGRMVLGKVQGESSERTYYAPSLGTFVRRTQRWEFQGTAGTGSGRGLLQSVVTLKK
jgi:hypothetical protein